MTPQQEQTLRTLRERITSLRLMPEALPLTSEEMFNANDALRAWADEHGWLFRCDRQGRTLCMGVGLYVPREDPPT